MSRIGSNDHPLAGEDVAPTPGLDLDARVAPA
jgi:hypothetical protein